MDDTTSGSSIISVVLAPSIIAIICILLGVVMVWLNRHNQRRVLQLDLPAIDSWECTRDDIMIGSNIGTDVFGNVYDGALCKTDTPSVGYVKFEQMITLQSKIPTFLLLSFPLLLIIDIDNYSWFTTIGHSICSWKIFFNFARHEFAFMDVYRSEKNFSCWYCSCRIIVRCCNQTSEVIMKRKFLEEAKMLKSLASDCHPNIVNLMGCCLQDEPLMLLVQQTSLGYEKKSMLLWVSE